MNPIPQTRTRPSATASPGDATGGAFAGRNRWRTAAWLLARRAVIAVPVVAAVTFGVFALAAWSPINPIEAYAGDSYQRMSTRQRADVAAAYGLDQPVWAQWWSWVRAAAGGDLGHSHVYDQPVTAVIAERLPWTLLLSGIALAVAVVVGTAAGTLAGTRPGSAWDRFATSAAAITQAVPPYVFAMVTILLFAVTWQLLPTGGLTPPGGSISVAGVATHVLLPATVLALTQLPWFLLSVRAQTVEVAASDAVRGARLRGLPEPVVLRGHILPAVLPPVVTLVGLRLPEVVAGAVLVEAVFAWPGIAGATVTAATRMDFPLLAALTALSAVVVLIGSAVADAVYALLDPRVGSS